MKIKRNIFLFLFIIIPASFIGIFFLKDINVLKNSFRKFIQENITEENRALVKKFIFPYREIDILKKNLYKTTATSNSFEQVLDYMATIALENDLQIKEKLLNLEFQKSPIIKTLSDSGNTSELEIKLKKYTPYKNILLRGINNPIPSSAYLEHYDNKLFLLSSIGVLAYSEPDEKKLDFKQIKNNINEFIGENQFKKKGLSHEEIKQTLPFSVKDLLIHNNKIYLSFTNEVSKNCWNTSVIYSDLNYENIDFKPLFAPKECVNSINNPDNVFLALQSGGRIVSFDNNHILLSTGDYRNRFLAQDKESSFGKILKININDKTYKVISMGSRNIQGLFVDQINEFILFTEHGPKGGDEINILSKEMISDIEIPNYGWAISSYGFHYRKTPHTKKYPLYKSHKKYGFVEPLKYFTPSIGISEIIGIDLNQKLYLVSSLSNHGLYLMKLNEKNEIIKFERLSADERIRDLITFQGNLYLFLEDTGSIGVIELDNFVMK